MSNKLRCSIVMPSFNEVEALRKTLYQIIENVKVDYECIVVVDSEDDLSCEVTRSFQIENKSVSLVINPIKKGRSASSTRFSYKVRM